MTGLANSADAPAWEWGPSVLWYVLRDERDYLQPTLTVDRGSLHLGARYDYEARNAGSAWIGWNLSFTLEWGPLALWSQSAYVFDLADSSQGFFYDWTEFSVTGPEWLRVGVVLQRPRAFQASTEVQGGPLIGVSFWQLSATAYLFAPGQQDQFLVLAGAGSFSSGEG